MATLVLSYQSKKSSSIKHNINRETLFPSYIDRSVVLVTADRMNINAFGGVIQPRWIAVWQDQWWTIFLMIEMCFPKPQYVKYLWLFDVDNLDSHSSSWHRIIIQKILIRSNCQNYIHIFSSSASRVDKQGFVFFTNCRSQLQTIWWYWNSSYAAWSSHSVKVHISMGLLYII